MVQTDNRLCRNYRLRSSIGFGGAKAEKGGAVGHADFARLQRKALEDYLIELIRAVVCTYY